MPRPDGRTGRLHVDGRDVAPVEVAETARARSRGLLGRDGLEGALVLRPARQVHTFRMRFPLDVAHVDRDGRVLRTATLAPNRVGRVVLRSRVVVEAEAGAFGLWGLAVGARIGIREAAAP